MTEAGKRVYDRLSPRKRVIVSLLASESLSNAQIARDLGTSTQMIKNYMKSIFDICGVENRGALILFAVRNGLVNDDE